MKVKRLAKKMIAIAITLVMAMSLMTTTAFARAEPCGMCNQGAMVGTETEEASAILHGPCMNGTDGEDYMIVVYRYTFKVCNKCGARLPVNAVKIYQSPFQCPHQSSDGNAMAVTTNFTEVITSEFSEKMQESMIKEFEKLNDSLANKPVVMAESCPSCMAGAAITHYITEEYTSWLGVCLHGFPQGEDAVVQTMRLYVTECTVCNYRLVHSIEVIKSENKCYGYY